jgi:hypothetical protein
VTGDVSRGDASWGSDVVAGNGDADAATVVVVAWGVTDCSDGTRPLIVEDVTVVASLPYCAVGIDAGRSSAWLLAVVELLAVGSVG